MPLTLGLSVLLAIMESVYVMTGRAIWRAMTRYWGLLFGINFAMGVATGITMEFQFGTNWAYYAHYVGDIFGAPLAIEGLMAFFLEATFVGMFFFGWDRLSRVGHLVVTCLLALGTNLSALWILVANGWMQHPVGASFNPQSMRMELTSFYDVLFNPVAQDKFVHTVSAGYVTGAMFVLSVSAWFLLQGRNREFAKRSMTVAASFGLASALSVVVLGDESGYTASQNQKMKLAAIEAMWETQTPPASFTVFGFPDTPARTTHYALRIPWVMGLLATRSLNQEVPGVDNLVAENEKRVAGGILAYGALDKLRANPKDDAGASPAFGPCRRSGLWALAEALHRQGDRRDPGPDSSGGARHRAQRAAAVLVVPVHGGLGLLFHRLVCVFLLAFGQAATRQPSRPICAWRCGRCRSRGWRRNWAGSSPNTAASPGPSTACCRHIFRFRRSPPAASPRASPDSCCSTARSRSSRFI